MKRFSEEGVLFPYQVPDEVIVRILYCGFQYESEKKDYIRMCRLKVLSKNVKRIVDELMSDIESLPLQIEFILSESDLIKLHRGIKVLRIAMYEPKTITSLKNLKEFSLSGTYENFPKGIERLTISTEKSFLSIPLEVLSSLTNVTLIRYRHPLERICMMSNLTSLNIDYNREVTDKIIQSLPQLIHLSARGTHIGNDAFIYSKNLKSLYIDQNKFVNRISHLYNLEILSCNMYISSDDIEVMTSLKTFFHPEWYKISSSIKFLTKLEELQIRGLEYHSIENLPTSLTSLDIEWCIDTFSSELLLTLTNLKKLSLPSSYECVESNITNEALSQMTSLTDLSLNGNCHIGDEGIVTLTNLRILNLYKTPQITRYALRKLTNLRTLELGHSVFTPHDLGCLPYLNKIWISSHDVYLWKETTIPSRINVEQHSVQK